jgi:hypothetical protein
MLYHPEKPISSLEPKGPLDDKGDKAYDTDFAMFYTLYHIFKQESILDLTGTDLIECMYGYTEMEALATYFEMDSESLLIQWQEFIQILSSSDNRSLTHLNELFQSVDHKDKNLSSMYPLVSKLYSIAIIQPLSTAEVERLFSQVALIKTSH